MSAPPAVYPVAPVGVVRLSPARACAMLATATQRAEVLLEVGYRIQPVDPTNGLFVVWRPATAKRKFDKDGNEIFLYFVQLATGRDRKGAILCPARCDCECFRLAGNCKHHLRVRSEVKRALRLFGLVPDPALDAWIEQRTSTPDPDPQTSAFRAESEGFPLRQEPQI